VKRIATLAVAIAVASISPASAFADEPTRAATPRARGPEDDRAVPDYDGRPDPPPDAGEVLIWVPRLVVAPIYLFVEYLVRRPWGFAITKSEHLMSETSEEENFGLAPSFLLETDRRPALGLMATWRELGGQHSDLRTYFAFGGIDWQRAIANYRIGVDQDASVALRIEAFRRPDQLYYGLGPEASTSRKSRYAADMLDGIVQLRAPAFPLLHLSADSGIRGTRFEAPPCCDAPSVRERVLRGQLERPPGFDGAVTWRQMLGLGFDTREPRGARGTGLAVDVDATHAMHLEPLEQGRWIAWGGAASGEVDVTGTERMLGLQLAVRFADPLGSGEVPFDELASLGGEPLMRGFIGGRLRDRSAAVATLGWRFPLWPYLEAHTEVACGSVWGAHLDGLSSDDLRLSFGGGIRTDRPAPEDWVLELFVGAGTERFADGTAPEVLRVLFALTPRF
jgi:hypothetical protein